MVEEREVENEAKNRTCLVSPEWGVIGGFQGVCSRGRGVGYADLHYGLIKFHPACLNLLIPHQTQFPGTN